MFMVDKSQEQEQDQNQKELPHLYPYQLLPPSLAVQKDLDNWAVRRRHWWQLSCTEA